MSDDSYSQLRKHIKSEGISIPRSLLERSILKTSLYAIVPHAFIWGALLFYYVGFVDYKYLPVFFMLFLASQRCFQTLVHDSSHRLFSKNMKRNDTVANYVIAGWIGSTLQAYRTIHFKHHAHNGSALDPEFISYGTIKKKYGGLIIYILRYIFCVEATRLFTKYYLNDKSTMNKNESKAVLSKSLIYDKLHIYVTQLTLLMLFILIDAGYLYILWVYIAVSWSPLLSGLRFLVEHPDETDKTVTTKSWFLEKIYFAPFNFNYHYEHHVWPSLPPYHLKEAHIYLCNQGFFERYPEYLNSSYITSLWANVK
jgi:fatty acid desaturase